MKFYRQTQYSRINAVQYAKKYALKPNPYYRYFSLDHTGGDCANFLSQCLFAGGAAMNSKWWYSHNNPSTINDTWSIRWTVAHSLYFYLKENQMSNLPGPKGLEVQDNRLLELGDLIFLEDTPNHIFHSAIVTSISNTQIYVSQHSFDALDIPYQQSWGAIKYHFIKINL